jgi:AraC-like DNA-binding protein
MKLKLPIRKCSAQLLECLGISLMHEYLNMAREQAGHADNTAPVNTAIRYMEEHYGDTNCLRLAIKESGISRNAIIYKFREAFNIPPARYLWKLRTEQGVAMLNDTGLSIAEIAYRCGFKNPYHFSRMIKAAQGSSPRIVRRKAWSGEKKMKLCQNNLPDD